jgi:hypothetical protein
MRFSQYKNIKYYFIIFINIHWKALKENKKIILFFDLLC